MAETARQVDPAHPQRTASVLWDIIDTAMDGIISLDENQNIVLFNAAAEQIFGYRAEEVMGRSVSILLPERYREPHRELVEAFGRGKIQHRRMGPQRTVMALRSNGEEFPIEASISHTVAEGGPIFTVILRDVSESVQFRARIQEQHQMLDQVSEAIKAVDLDGRITYWNRAAERLFGWTSAEALGKNAFELLYRDDPDVLTEIRRAMEEGRSWVGELLKETRSGKPVLVEHRQTPLRDDAQQVRGYICLNIDISDRRKRERAERRSQRLESIGTLAGGIAHDLNNVLTPILMGAKLLASGRAAANREGLLQTMVASAERGSALIRQLLTFAGGVQGDRTPQRIDELIGETRGMIDHILPKSIRIETSVPPGLPAVVGDATELTQVLMNLCINARDAMPEGGVLTIEAESVFLNGTSKRMHPDARPGEYVCIKVTDTGVGMTPEVLDRIFDPFFTTKEVGRGTGLGLATVQGIVKGHGGFITVYSEPGLGSKFSIFLPATSTGADRASVSSSAAGSVGQNRTVLLVDDEEAILQMTSAALEDAGYRVLSAKDGTEAIRTFSAHRKDVAAVVLDMMMPNVDGLQVLDELRRIDPDVNVIVCSGLQTKEREQEARLRGAKAFLAKPYSDEHLRQALSDVLQEQSPRSGSR